MPRTLLPAASLLLVACAMTPEEAVWEAERAFATTMAERDHAAFVAFLAQEAVFVGGGRTVVGRDGVAAAWRPFFETPAAPFSWRPDSVVVAENGEVALSTGPVSGPEGQDLGRFTSLWRRTEEGWRVVFDTGESPQD